MLRPRRHCAPRWGTGVPAAAFTGRDVIIWKADLPTVVRDPHCPIHAIFRQHMGGPEGVVDLIELPLMRDGEVLTQVAGRLDA